LQLRIITIFACILSLEFFASVYSKQISEDRERGGDEERERQREQEMDRTEGKEMNKQK